MRLDVTETIVAIASASGASLRGVVRVTGPQAMDVLDRLTENGDLIPDGGCSESFAELIEPIAVHSRVSFGPQEVLAAEVLVWPSNSSFTRQPSAEIHTLGCPPLLQRILDTFYTVGCRAAEPGEFTMRAFLSGRLDLPQAEAILGLIDSKTERQFEASLNQLSGGIGGPLNQIKTKLLHVLAELEAGLDFVDEDIEFVSNDEVARSLETAHQQMVKAQRQWRGRQLVDERMTVVLAGEPNAGKSSLFNCLSGGQAIVSETAGTTRDYLYADLEIGGVPIRLVDTAGVAIESPDHQCIDADISSIAYREIETADLVLVCVDSTTTVGPFERRLLDAGEPLALLVGTKADLPGAGLLEATIRVSSQLGTGIEALKASMVEFAKRSGDTAAAIPATLSRIRHRIEKSEEAICAAKESVQFNLGEEVTAAEIRVALEHLGMIVGAVYTDDILDLVFSRFCIGK